MDGDCGPGPGSGLGLGFGPGVGDFPPGVGDECPAGWVLGLPSMRGMVIDIGVEVVVAKGLCELVCCVFPAGKIVSVFSLPSAAPTNAKKRIAASSTPHTMLNFILRVLARYHNRGVDCKVGCMGCSCHDRCNPLWVGCADRKLL